MTFAKQVKKNVEKAIRVCLGNILAIAFSTMTKKKEASEQAKAISQRLKKPRNGANKKVDRGERK